jgi:tetratricopeptide (TPR) repeat protein
MDKETSEQENGQGNEQVNKEFSAEYEQPEKPTSRSQRSSSFRNILVSIFAIAIIAGGIYVLFTKGPDIPDLDRPFTITEQYPEDIKKQMEESYANAVEELRDNPSLKSRWLEVAVLRKNVNDFEGAEEVWLYIVESKEWEGDTTALNNLGDLYQYYLKDFPKAEVMLRTSLERNPAEIAVYKNLHDLYRYRYKQDTSSAEEILLEGLDMNPETLLDLLVMLALYYKDMNRFEDARVRLLEARSLAETTGNNALLGAINAELTILPAE